MVIKLFKSVNGVVQINQPHIKIAVIVDQINVEDSQNYYKGSLRPVQISFTPSDFTHYEEIQSNYFLSYGLLPIINHLDEKEFISSRLYNPYFEARTDSQFSQNEKQSYDVESETYTLVGVLCIVK